MGAGNRVRNSEAWVVFNAVHARDTTWKEVNRAWVRDSNTWKQVYTVEQPPSIRCATLQLCQVGGDPGCATEPGCVANGEQHRIQWHFSGAATGYHASIHRSVGGGGFVEWADSVDIDGGEPDAGCCVEGSSCGGGLTPNGKYLNQYSRSSALGACTTTYQYRVRAEIDGTDTQVGDSADTETNTGCDETCIS